MTTTPEQVARALSADAWQDAQTALLTRIALTVEGNVKLHTPVRTGTLRRSITHRVEAAAGRAIVGTNVVYARVVHEGLRGHTAQPFLDEGLAASRDTIDRLCEQAGTRFFAAVAR